VEPSAILGYLAIAFVGGAFGALVGLGGATFIIPLATLLLAPDTQQLRAAAMVSNCCVALGALAPYMRAGQVDWRTVRLVAPWAVATVAVGVWMSVGIDAILYRGLFGGFVLATVAHELRRLLKPPRTPAEERLMTPWAGAATGTVAGLAGGVLSVGGGVVFMPVLREWLGTPVKRAAATSMAMVLPSVAVGAVAQMWSMHVQPDGRGGTLLPGALAIAACLAPAALAGGWTGARISARLPREAVQWAVVVALGTAGVLLMRPWVLRLLEGPAP
jgi:uncharacterized membrane protein YfcA